MGDLSRNMSQLPIQWGLLCGSFVGIFEICRLSSPTLLLFSYFKGENEISKNYVTLMDHTLGGTMGSLFLGNLIQKNKQVNKRKIFRKSIPGVILGLSSGIAEMS